MEPDQKSTQPTDWHGIFGTMLQLELSFPEITLHAKHGVMSQPPETDFVLIYKSEDSLHEDYRHHLPDGVQQSRASHFIFEFKFTESLNIVILRKVLGYDTFYKDAQNFSDNDVQTFIISSKTPQRAFLERFEYKQKGQPGIYESEIDLLKPVKLILLNQLTPEPHNAFIKCFASRKRERRRAFEAIRQINLTQYPDQLYWLMAGLWQRWFESEGDLMPNVITAETLIEEGKMWVESLLNRLPPEEILGRYKPEQVLGHYKPEQVLGHYKPEERMGGLSIEEIEAYLTQRKQQDAANGSNGASPNGDAKNEH